MCRMFSDLFLAGALLCLLLVLTSCDRPGSKTLSETTTDTPSSNVSANGKLQYGPVYPARAISDPLVARTVESAETTGAAVASAEIRGFLVDWVKRRTKGASAREFAVMKDGNLYSRVGGPPLGGGPIAVHMKIPPRLAPEPPLEAQSREAALAAANKTVAEIDPEYKAVEPVVINYLVRIYLKDRSSVDVWVDLEGNPERFTSEYKLQKAEY